MVGNSAEEGLMQQIGNPSHTDAGRIIAPAALVSAAVVFLTLGRALPVLGVASRLGLAVLALILVALVLHRFLSRRRLCREAAIHRARRAAQEAETERRIAAMKGERR